MTRAASLAWLLVAAAVLAPAGLSGQAYPVTSIFEIAPPWESSDPEVSYSFIGPLSAVPVGAGWAVAWVTAKRDQRPDQFDYNDFDVPEGRLVSTAASLGPRFGRDYGFARDPRLVSTARQGFAMVWGEEDYPSVDVRLQRWASGAVPLQEFSTRVNEYHDGVYHLGCSVAVTPSGRLVVAWTEILFSNTVLVRPWMRVLDRTGEPVTDEIEVAPPFELKSDYEEISTEVLVDTAGRILVVWYEPGPAGVPRRWWGRHFRTDGTPLKERFLVADAGPGEVRIAKRAGGGFTALWSPPAQEGIPTPWLLRRFRSTGAPFGAPVAAGPAGPFKPQLAVDRHGNLAVVGMAGEEAAVRLFNSYLVAQGEPVLIGVRPEDVYGWDPTKSIAVSLHDGGRFLAAWINGRSDSPRSILGRIWETARDDDLCLYRGNRFLCNTAGIYGDRPDATISFGDGSPGNIPLMADVNADGRDDPCLYRNGRIVCDTAHDGGTAELKMAPFGRPGDAILLGDVDGDGRADPCVRRGTRFLCDLAHDGGEPEFSVGFGNPQDIPVMAGHNSAPCVFRKGLFLCDTARDGGTAELRIDLRPWIGNREPVEPFIPLLGDINGDGWNDACVYAGGGYFCGIVRPGSRFPVEVIDRNFGQVGDRAVLGDIDAF